MSQRPKYSTVQQYEPLRAPENWGDSGRQFVVRLTAILDDIYRRYGRLTTADLGAALNAVLLELRNDTNALQSTIGDLRTSVDEHGSRLDIIDTTLDQRATGYAADMLEISNALNNRVQKTNVIGDINDSTETEQIHHAKVAFTGATIGGLHVEGGRVYTDGGVEITNAGVKVGGFSAAVDSDGNITLTSGENSLILSLEQTVTGVTSNVYIDPVTGALQRII